jgi:hypothetical protein
VGLPVFLLFKQAPIGLPMGEAAASIEVRSRQVYTPLRPNMPVQASLARELSTVDAKIQFGQTFIALA